MGKVLEYTLVGAKNTFADKLGCAVKIGTEAVHRTPKAVLATAEGAIDGIITDITVTGANEVTLAVAKTGDIVFAKAGGAITIGAELEVGANGVLTVKADGAVVAKALTAGVQGELIPVLIK